MAQRIPMRIYQLTQTNTNVSTIFGYGLSPVVGPSQFLIGVNQDNILFYGTAQGKSLNNSAAVGTISLNINNIPAAASGSVGGILITSTPRTYIVQSEAAPNSQTPNYYIELATYKFYIAPSQLSKSDPTASPLVFEFYVNPQHLTPTYRKLQTEIRTRGAWEIQHWGNALTELKVSGRTGGLQRDATKPLNPGQRTTDKVQAQTLSSTQPITESTAWKKLLQLKTLYNNDHAAYNTEQVYKIGFNYYDSFYVGYFTDFMGPEADAESPYIMNYSFTIKVEQETSLTTAQISSIAGVALT